MFEIVWLRLAMAAFGVTTPMVSMVLSIFMGGLALGSYAAGRFTTRRAGAPPGFFLAVYAGAELIVGSSALVLPLVLDAGRRALHTGASGTPWGSLAHYGAAGLWLTLALLPFCVCMGATFPLVLAALGGDRPARRFGLLYLANVLGATAGTLASVFVMVELLGFRDTLRVTGCINLLLATVAFSRRRMNAPTSEARSIADVVPANPHVLARPLLFMTGLTSMAMEVVWTRQFTPYVGSFVFAFAEILGLYLASTALGSFAYQAFPGRLAGAAAPLRCGILLGLFGLLPLLAADPRLPVGPGVLAGAARVALGVAPFCALLGYLTPLLVDRDANGSPGRTGTAYALNVVGCIVGPLIAGFVLLPNVSERQALGILSLPLLSVAAYDLRRLAPWALAAGAAGMLLVGRTQGWEQLLEPRVVKRNFMATVAASGRDFERTLTVNGIGMTTLTPVTKVMAHLPAASLPDGPHSALVVCFGMGTTFRSLLAWGIPTTAVELDPSVPALFSYFHEEAPLLLSRPQARVVVDDGRRFLARTADRFDLVTIDPPPPAEAAGSGLLYSIEFYDLVKRRLQPTAVVEQWIPACDLTTLVAVTRSLRASFPQVRVFRGFGGFGYHFLASNQALERLTAAELARRLPAAAAVDLVEWGPHATPEAQLDAILSTEIPVETILGFGPEVPALTDDRPVNEYFFLRRSLGSELGVGFPDTKAPAAGETPAPRPDRASH